MGHSQPRTGILIAIAAVALVAVALTLGLVPLPGAGDTGAEAGTAIGTGDGSDSITLDEVGDFESPVHIAFAPGSGNVYVVEQEGTVRVVAGGTTQAEPFLDISNRTAGSSEQGLLSIAFDPQFESNGLLYAYYTDGNTGDIRIDEFHAEGATDADEASRRPVLRIRHRFASNHNGGQIQFGPDGFLYAGTGDGGVFGDTRENGQNRNSLLGKLLRINPHGDEPFEHRNPAGNPFRKKPGRDEIYAVGLRNPWRFSFDLLTDRIVIGDVGQNRFEEINYETPKALRGANFGWDRYEGLRRYDEPGDNESPRPEARFHDKPIHTYRHGSRCSIIGGYVVRDLALPTLYGRYLYTDLCDGRLRSLIPGLQNATDDKPIGIEHVSGPTSFGQNPATGELYVASQDGPVYELIPEDGP